MRIFEPAFNERNIHITNWIIRGGVIFVFFFTVGIIGDDLSRFEGSVDEKLRSTAWQRMSEACYTQSEIKEIWYDWQYFKHHKKLLVMIRGREALCGGRGECRCGTEKADEKGSV